MVLFIFLSQIYGAVQLFVLSSLSRTTLWRSILFGFIAGMAASASAALLTERGCALLFAAALHRPLSSITVFDSYTLDPIVEEFCKVLPLLLVLFIRRVRTRLTFSDAVVICAALGSGFGFTEITLRYGYGARAAHWSGAYWVISQGFSSSGIPGIGVILRSWLPVGVTQFGGFARPKVGLNTHLVWSAMVGLAIGVALRGRGKWKWTALLLFVFACLDHATSNAAQLRVRFPFMLSSALAALRRFDAFYALITLVAAIYLDRSVFKRGLADEPTLTSPVTVRAVLAYGRGNLRRPSVLLSLWSYVLERRAFGLHRAVNPSDQELAVERANLVAAGKMFEHTGTSSPPLAARPFKTPNAGNKKQQPLLGYLRRVIFPLLVIPPLSCFVIGDFPATASLQRAFADPQVFRVLSWLLMAGIVIQVLVLAHSAAAFRSMLNRAHVQVLLLSGLSLYATLGGLVFGAASLLTSPGHKPLQQISAYPNLWSAFAGSNMLTAVLVGLLLGSLALTPLPEIITSAFLANIIAGLTNAAITGAVGYLFNGLPGFAVGVGTSFVFGFFSPFLSAAIQNLPVAAQFAATALFTGFTTVLSTWLTNIALGQPSSEHVLSSALIATAAIFASLEAPASLLFPSAGWLPETIMSLNTSLLDTAGDKLYDKLSAPKRDIE